MTTTPQAALLSEAERCAKNLNKWNANDDCWSPEHIRARSEAELRRLDALVAHLTADRDDTANELALRTKHNLALTNERDQLLARLQATQAEPVQAGELPEEPDMESALAAMGITVWGPRAEAFKAGADWQAALSARKPLTDGQSKPLPPNIGDYVLATKYSDGDPGDAWALGFYAGNVEDRHLVNDAAGLAIRLGGYRRVGRIPTEIGNWLWANRDNLERAPLKISLWGMYDWAYVNEMLAPGSCGIGLEVKP